MGTAPRRLTKEERVYLNSLFDSHDAKPLWEWDREEAKFIEWRDTGGKLPGET